MSDVERRDPKSPGAVDRRQHPDRRRVPRPPGGRRANDEPTGNAWTTGQLAFHIGMSRGFVLGEIKDRQIIASQFGREYRIAAAEVRRYLGAKGFPLPDFLTPQATFSLTKALLGQLIIDADDVLVHPDRRRCGRFPAAHARQLSVHERQTRSRQVSRWYESIDRQPGAAPLIRAAPGMITFELRIVGLRQDTASRPRIFLRCTDDGTITLRLLAGRSTAA